MSDFLTSDGQTFDTLEEAKAHTLTRKLEIDGFHLCFVQEVRLIQRGVWQHFENFSTPEEHSIKFHKAADEATFCVYSPGTGENIYCFGKPDTLALVAKLVDAHADSTYLTKIYKRTDEVDVIWPYMEIQ